MCFAVLIKPVINYKHVPVFGTISHQSLLSLLNPRFQAASAMMWTFHRSAVPVARPFLPTRDEPRDPRKTNGRQRGRQKLRKQRRCHATQERKVWKMASSNHTAYTSQIIGLPASADACYQLSATWDSLTVTRHEVAEISRRDPGWFNKISNWVKLWANSYL